MRLKYMDSFKVILFTVFSSIALVSCGTSVEKKPEIPPNIIWINSDDLGVEVGCYGNKDVKTPNIDRLAKEGTLYENSYANAPICSNSRSSMITGMYPPSVNSHDHRTINKTELPEGIVPITKLFQKAGYFCTNGSASNMKRKGKEDFNFKSEYLFDGTDWNQRAEGQPFFAQIQIHSPHRLFVEDQENPISADNVTLPACYPDHPLLKADWVNYLESVQDSDKYVGNFLARLEKEGLLENSILFFFGDNGRPHLRDKQFLYEGGLKVPIIVRYPKKVKANYRDTQLVSLIDVTTTSLAMAGISIPSYMQGIVFLGQKAEKREYVYGFRQRAGDAAENMRSITDGKYKMIWNRTTDRPWMQLTSYKKLQYPAFALYKVLHEKGALKAPFNSFMRATKPEIELFDLHADPMEFNNLAANKSYASVKERLYKNLSAEMLGFEKNMILEDEETIQLAKESSKKYYKNVLQKQKPGLSVDASYEEIVKDWEQRLLN